MKEKKTKLSVIMAFYVTAILVGLPIIYHDYYYDILQVKYYYYCGCVAAMLIAVFFYTLYTGILKKSCLRLNGKIIGKSFTVVDWAHMVFWLLAAISTLLSPFKYEAFWGNEGRLCGFFLITLYTVSYFCITRWFQMRRWYVDIFLAAGLVVCLFGITDFFNLDLLGFEKHLGSVEIYMFTSFIGNVNFYTELVAIYMGIAAVMWIGTQNKIRSVWYFICLWIIFLAAIMGQSDNVYLAMAALFSILPLYAFRTRRGLKRYFVLIATFLTCLKIVEWVSGKYWEKVIHLDSMYNVLMGYEKLTLIIISLWVVIAVVYLYDYMGKKKDETLSPWLWRSWLTAFIAAVLGVCYILYDVNIAGHGSAYGSLQGYLKFDDNWGSARGFVWRTAVENYKRFPLIRKIFGYGPETFSIIAYYNNAHEMNEAYGLFFENVHNEYLQYLMTIGLMGMLGYLVLLGSSFVTAVRKGADRLYLMAVMMGVFCYAVQAVINISQPIVTPIMWTLLSMGMAGCRNENNKGE